MQTLSIFTSMTDPDSRNDAWKEALECYNSLGDEVIVVGKNWPKEFNWKQIGETFQEGFDLCKSDWVIRMDVDYFFHEKDFKKIRKALNRFKDYPAISFPQYQFFTPERYQLKTRLCLAFNKSKFPNIKLNGGGDLTLATLNGELIDPKKVPNLFVPIYQYESIFRTKKIIEIDRSRFARAWNRYFGSYGDRGGGSGEKAFNAWFDMVKERYPKHNFKMKLSNHPKFIKKRLENIDKEQFGYNAFGLKEKNTISLIYNLKGIREKYINHFLLKIHYFFISKLSFKVKKTK